MPKKPPLKLESSKRFQKDYAKLVLKYPKIREEIEAIVTRLVNRQPLGPGKRDHPLKGNLKGFRDCHVRGDVVLIYRIGSHSELGL